MFDDFGDPLDPLDPMYPVFWAEWVCPHCAEDGSRGDLADGRCPNCGAKVELMP